MKLSRIFHQVWPTAIVGGLFMVMLDLLGLTVYLPVVTGIQPTGDYAVSYGLILWTTMVIFLVGMIGLYIRRTSIEIPLRKAVGKRLYREPELLEKGDVEESERYGMQLAGTLQYVWPAAIVCGLFMVMSDLLGLTMYLPAVAEAQPTGYYAFNYGIVSGAMVLFLVGMVGLYVRQREAEDSLREAARDQFYRELLGEDGVEEPELVGV